MARVLVTGIGGFLGVQVTEALVMAGHQVRGLMGARAPHPRLAELGVEIVRGNVAEPAGLASACGGVDTILHLAARASDWGDWARMFELHVHGTDNVLRAARHAGVRRLVLLSSLAVHRPAPRRGADEHTPRDRLDHPYAASRLHAERLVEHAHARGEIEGVIVRPGTLVLGPGDGAPRNLPALARYLRLGIVPVVAGGLARTCVSYSENLADGLLLAATHPEAPGRAFVMEDGVCVSWRHVFRSIAAAIGVAPPLFVSVPSRVAGIVAAAAEAHARTRRAAREPLLTRYRVDLMRHDSHFVSDRARVLLGYAPRVGFYEALERAVARDPARPTTQPFPRRPP